MAEVEVINEFLRLLERSKLLTPAQVRKATTNFGLDQYDDARGAATKLVRERIITPFQADRLLEGRYRGFLIDHFKIREILGTGGMGSVYIAEDTQKKQKVAIKILSNEHELDAGMITRLEMEARAGMLLDHPNIVKTYHYDSTGAVQYVVMELVRGVSLHELIAINGPVAMNMACSIIRQIALGLHAAHEQGIIHRDVKPANFLIAKDGSAKILDFGLALIEDDAANEFALAMIHGHDCLGTPDFISPEQIVDSGKVDPTTDIYSLGGTLYLALTARLPFPQKTNRAKLEAQKTLPPKNILKHKPDLPEQLARIVHTMLAKDPKKRFQSAMQVAKALEPFAAQRALSFDFRQIVTLRAKQAKAKRDVVKARRKAKRLSSSSIQGSSGIIGRSGTGLQSEIDTQVGRSETPAVTEAQRRRTPTPPTKSRAYEPPSTAVEAAASSVPAGWYLRPSGGSAVPMRKSKIVLGRSGSCDVVVDAKGISSNHCELSYDAGHWSLRDLDSRNGTYVNGSRVDHWILSSGDVLRLGENCEYLVDNGSAKRQSSGGSGAWIPFAVVGGIALLLIVVLYMAFG